MFEIQKLNSRRVGTTLGNEESNRIVNTDLRNFQLKQPLKLREVTETSRIFQMLYYLDVGDHSHKEYDPPTSNFIMQWRFIMAGEMNYSLSDLRAAVGDGDGFGGNNGLIWLLFLWAMMGGNWNGNRYGCGEFLNKVGVEAASANQIEDLSRQVTQDALRGAIAGNHDAIDALSKQLCCSTADITAAISGVNTAMLQGFSGIQSLVQSCCCSVKEKIGDTANQINVGMLQGFNGVDKTLCSLNTNMLQGFSSINTSVERGFASTNFAAEKNYQALSAQLDRNHTAQLINNDKNTDRIIQFMTEKTMTELRDRAAKAEVELSQRDQSAYILNQLRSNNCGGCGNCGGCC